MACSRSSRVSGDSLWLVGGLEDTLNDSERKRLVIEKEMMDESGKHLIYQH